VWLAANPRRPAIWLQRLSVSYRIFFFNPKSFELIVPSLISHSTAFLLFCVLFFRSLEFYNHSVLFFSCLLTQSRGTAWQLQNQKKLSSASHLRLAGKTNQHVLPWLPSSLMLNERKIPMPFVCFLCTRVHAWLHCRASLSRM
jgi:hypothetical protein